MLLGHPSRMERIRLKAGLAFEGSGYENHLPPRNLACSFAAFKQERKLKILCAALGPQADMPCQNLRQQQG